MPGLADLMGAASPPMQQPQQPQGGPQGAVPNAKALLMAWYQLVQQGVDPEQAIAQIAQQFGVPPQALAGLIQQVVAQQQGGQGGTPQTGGM